MSFKSQLAEGTEEINDLDHHKQFKVDPQLKEFIQFNKEKQARVKPQPTAFLAKKEKSYQFSSDNIDEVQAIYNKRQENRLLYQQKVEANLLQQGTEPKLLDTNIIGTEWFLAGALVVIAFALYIFKFKGKKEQQVNLKQTKGLDNEGRNKFLSNSKFVSKSKENDYQIQKS